MRLAAALTAVGLCVRPAPADSTGVALRWQASAFATATEIGAGGYAARDSLGGLLAGEARWGSHLSLRVGVGAWLAPNSVAYDAIDGSGSARVARWRFQLDEFFARLDLSPKGWGLQGKAGLFSQRTDPDAALAGEYLLSYQTYPQVPLRAGRPWDRPDEPSVRAWGLSASVLSPAKAWHHEALLLLDTLPHWGTHELSLAYLLSHAPTAGFEWGAGFEWFGLAGLGAPDGGEDPAGPFVKTDSGWFVPDAPDSTGSPEVDTVYYTFHREGVKAMVRAAWDAKAWLPLKSRKRWDGRVFAEAALNGLANQPIFYENRGDRFYFTAGADVPTFGVLDRFCVQWESRPALVIQSTNVAWMSPARIDMRHDRGWTLAAMVEREFFAHLSVSATFRRMYDPPPPQSEYLPTLFTLDFPDTQNFFALRLDAHFN